MGHTTLSADKANRRNQEYKSNGLLVVLGKKTPNGPYQRKLKARRTLRATPGNIRIHKDPRVLAPPVARLKVA